MTSSVARADGLALQLDQSLNSDLAADFRDSVAANTWKAYRADLTDYEDWCRAKRRRWSTPDTVAAYLRAMESAGAAYATIVRRKTAIAKLLEARALLAEGTGDIDPTKHPKVTVTLKAIRRRIGADQDRATPLTGERLVQVLRSIDGDTNAGRRDTAMLLVGWYGALRRSELAAMRSPHLDLDDHGLGLALPYSKTAQDHTVYVPILRQQGSRWCPIAALDDWLKNLDDRRISDTTDGVWLHITKGDTFGSRPRAISGDAVNNIVTRRVLAAGLPDASSYSAHSLRSGFVTEAKNRGIDEADIMKHTRHKSLVTMRLYDRTSGWWNRNATSGLAL